MTLRIVRTLIILVALAVISCTTTGRNMHRIEPGMTKGAVVRVLGKPRSVGGANNVEVLHYMDDRGFWQYDHYFVRLVNGKVESYGPRVKGQSRDCNESSTETRKMRLAQLDALQGEVGAGRKC